MNILVCGILVFFVLIHVYARGGCGTSCHEKRRIARRFEINKTRIWLENIAKPAMTGFCETSVVDENPNTCNRINAVFLGQLPNQTDIMFLDNSIKRWLPNDNEIISQQFVEEVSKYIWMEQSHLQNLLLYHFICGQSRIDVVKFFNCEIYDEICCIVKWSYK
jgi:hypothetical protein